MKQIIVKESPQLRRGLEEMAKENGFEAEARETMNIALKVKLFAIEDMEDLFANYDTLSHMTTPEGWEPEIVDENEEDTLYQLLNFGRKYVLQRGVLDGVYLTNHKHIMNSQRYKMSAFSVEDRKGNEILGLYETSVLDLGINDDTIELARQKTKELQDFLANPNVPVNIMFKALSPVNGIPERLSISLIKITK